MDLDILQQWEFGQIGSLGELVVALLVCAVLGIALELVYVRCGTSFSDRSRLGRHFYLLAMTTALVISIVKSSLALSLGLVGALSIVRFRTAIKDPEELVYLFVCIGIGLGVGADLVPLTVAAACIIMAIILVRHAVRVGRVDRAAYYLHLAGPEHEAASVAAEACSRHGVHLTLSRYDRADGRAEVTYLLGRMSSGTMDALVRDLAEALPDTDVCFVEQNAAFEG
ncbi:MAG: DUF4956 domain-containing protein [Chloroflexi bacterium]|nr:DUF4956 domain-containing protein [Chloroflexota bacterium]